MSIGVEPIAPVKLEVGEIEIEVRGRWDALALSEILVPFHSFLVQHARERWVVHARAPGWRGEPLIEALGAIDEWRNERSAEALVRLDVWPHGKPRPSATRSRGSAASATQFSAPISSGAGRGDSGQHRSHHRRRSVDR